MDDMVVFLIERLDEDEQVARAAVGFDYGVRDWADDGDPVNVHIARHDPARVLADVQAARKTLVRCQKEMLSGIPRLVHFARQTLWEMAQRWADHEDYPKGWRP